MCRRHGDDSFVNLMCELDAKIKLPLLPTSVFGLAFTPLPHTPDLSHNWCIQTATVLHNGCSSLVLH